MKNRLFILLILFAFVACEDYSRTNYYEFVVENQMSDKTVKIVPKSKTDFWISSKDSYVVVSGEKIIIGTKLVHYGGDDRPKPPKYAFDIYKPDEIMEPFELYIDDIKQEKTFSFRKFWDFSLGSVNESGKYTLVINENTLNN